jgi:hypothetical protein
MAERALGVAPDHPAAHDVMRAVLMAMGREAEALPHARRALQGAPEEPSGGSSRVDLQACKLGTGRRFTTS